MFFFQSISGYCLLPGDRFTQIVQFPGIVIVSKIQYENVRGNLTLAHTGWISCCHVEEEGGI